jgi:hypothetical protein
MTESIGIRYLDAATGEIKSLTLKESRESLLIAEIYGQHYNVCPTCQSQGVCNYGTWLLTNYLTASNNEIYLEAIQRRKQ